MKSKYIILFFFWLCFGLQLTSGQNYNKLLPVKINGKSGLINYQGEIVVAIKYDAIDPFDNNGIAIVHQKNKIGYINQYGKEFIPPIYDRIVCINVNLFKVSNGDETSVVDSNHLVLLPFKNWTLEYIGAGLFGFSFDTLWGVISSADKVLLPDLYSIVDVYEEKYILADLIDTHFVFNLEGKALLNRGYKNLYISENNLLFYKDSLYWGVSDSSGNKIVDEVWDKFFELSNGICLKSEDKWHIYSLSSGKIISKKPYDNVYPFFYYENYILCVDGFLKGVFTCDSGEIVSPNYEDIKILNGRGFLLTKNNLKGFAQMDGKIVLEPEFSDIDLSSDSNIIITRKGDGYGLANIHGDILFPATAQLIEVYFSLAKIYNKNSINIIFFDENGRFVEKDTLAKINTIQVKATNERRDRSTTTSGNDFKSNWFYSSQKHRWGLKDSTGKLLIEPRFESIKEIRSLNAAMVYSTFSSADYKFHFIGKDVKFNKTTALVDSKTGRFIIHPRISEVRYQDFDSGRSIARIIGPGNSNFGYVFSNGRIINDSISYFGVFKDGLARICYKGSNFNSGYKSRSFSKEQTEILDTIWYIWDDCNCVSGTSSAFRDNLKFQANNREFYSDRTIIESFLFYNKGGKWGFLDEKGKQVIPPEYSYLRDFNNKRAIAKKGNLWGVIDVANNTVLDFKYDFITYLQETNNRIFKLETDNRKIGLLDYEGNVIVEHLFDEAGKFSEGLIKIRIGKSWGYADTNGKIVIKPEYLSVSDFHEGYAAVKKKRSWGYINVNGENVIPFAFRVAGDFSSGLARVIEKSKLGYINEYGNYIIKPKYSGLSQDFKNGIAIIKSKSRFGIINTEGKWILHPVYKSIDDFNEAGIKIVKRRNRYGLVDLTGKKIIPIKYKEIGKLSEGLIAVKKHNKWGFCDTNGKIIIDFNFDNAHEFSEGLAGVKEKGRWGYIDKSGKMIISPQFSDAMAFHQNRAVIKSKRQFGIIDTKGNQILKPAFTKISDFKDNIALVKYYLGCYFVDTNGLILFNQTKFINGSEFEDDLSIIKINGYFGVINKFGSYTCQPKYSGMVNLGSNRFGYTIPVYSGVSDLNGNVLLNPEYELIKYIKDDIIAVDYKNLTGYYNLNKGWIWNPADFNKIVVQINK